MIQGVAAEVETRDGPVESQDHTIGIDGLRYDGIIMPRDVPLYRSSIDEATGQRVSVISCAVVSRHVDVSGRNIEQCPEFVTWRR